MRNIHCFNQGIELITDLVCSSLFPDIIQLQEHWLSPANLSVFGDKITTRYALAVQLCPTKLPEVPCMAVLTAAPRY